MPRLLDLFCGAGGAAMGYHRAGFEVVGVDIKPQPHYPFEFHQANALTFPVNDFDAIHASPPCQAYSAMTPYRSIHPDLIGETRDLVIASGLPFVIENVVYAPVRADFSICGCVFGLRVRRRRLFETNWSGLQLMPSCAHLEPALTVVGNGTPGWSRKKLGFNPSVEDCREAMGIDWMTRRELSQAIPPHIPSISAENSWSI